MACPTKRKVLQVLLGQLGGGASQKVLEHCRVCGECREAFDFAAQTMTKTAGAAGVGAAIAAGPVIEEMPSGKSGWAFKRNRRTLFAFAAVACAILLAGVGRGGKGTDAAVALAPEARWRASLAEGTPVVTAPEGLFEARPRVVTGIVPPGASAFVVTFFDQSGQVVLQRDAKPGESGCFVEPGEIAAPGGAFRASRFVAPFPDEGALPLPPGQAFGVVIGVGGGHVSHATTFQVAPALQGVAAEKR